MIIPVAGHSVASTTGGGFLSNIMSSFTGGAAATDPAAQTAGQTAQTGAAGSLLGGSPAQSDGSVGLFDGVWKKALFGGAAGVGIGFLPFIPGGPLIGGLVGSVIGAGIGIWGNYKKIKNIQTQNQAFVAAVGIQPQTQEEAQALLSGNIKQLYTADPNQAAATQQTSADQQAQLAAQQQLYAQQQANAAQQAQIQQQFAAQTKDPATGTVQEVPTAPATQTTQAADQSAAAVVGPQQAVATQQTGGVKPFDQSVFNTANLVPTESAQVSTEPQIIAIPGGGTADPAQADAEAADVKTLAEKRLQAHEERMREIWLKASPEQKQRILDRLQQRIAALQAQVQELLANTAAPTAQASAQQGSDMLVAPAAA